MSDMFDPDEFEAHPEYDKPTCPTCAERVQRERAEKLQAALDRVAMRVREVTP